MVLSVRVISQSSEEGNGSPETVVTDSLGYSKSPWNGTCVL